MLLHSAPVEVFKCSSRAILCGTHCSSPNRRWQGHEWPWAGLPVQERVNNWWKTQRYAKALLAMAATCSLSKTCDSKGTPRFCNKSVWGTATSSRTKGRTFLAIKDPNTQSYSVLLGLNWSLLHFFQAPRPSRHWDRMSLASLKQPGIEMYSWVSSTYWWHFT